MDDIDYSWSLKKETEYPYHAAWVGPKDGKKTLMFNGWEVDGDKVNRKFYYYTPQTGPVFFDKPPPLKDKEIKLSMPSKVPRYAQLYVMDGKITGIQWRGTIYNTVQGMESWEQVISKNGNSCVVIPQGTTLFKV